MHGISSRSTTDFCAVTATAKRMLQPYDPKFADQCWNAAVKADAWLNANPAYLVEDNQNYPDFNGSDLDERLWAACEMWGPRPESGWKLGFGATCIRSPIRPAFLADLT